MKNIKIIETMSDGTQKELCISDVISSFLRENLKVCVKQDYNFSKRTEDAYDVVVMLGEEEISKTDFTIYK